MLAAAPATFGPRRPDARADSGPASAPAVPTLTWLGRACFLLETPSGTRVVMDPAGPGPGVAMPDNLTADVVTISHEHPEHNHAGAVAGRPHVLRGLTPDRKGWLKLDERVREVGIRTIGVYRDEERGRLRGLSTVFVFEVGGLRIAHLGGLGHLLSDRDLSLFGSVDVVLIAIEEGGALDPHQAGRVIDQIRPRLLAVPMRHEGRGDAATPDPPPALRAFLESRPHVRQAESNVLPIRGVKQRPGAEIVVLAPPRR